jgi:gag-polyprotein putative aspartyl protease
MRTHHWCVISGVAIFGGWVLLFSVEGARADEAEAKAKLAAKGIRATHTGCSLVAESEFAKSVSTAYSLKRKHAASKQQEHAAIDKEAAAEQIQVLKAQNEVLRNRLAEVTKVPFTGRGNVVQDINNQIAANDREIAETQEAINPSKKPADDGHKQDGSSSKDKSSPDVYIQEIFEARKTADLLLARYAELNQDKEVVAALKEWNEAAHASIALKPSHSFESALKRLETLEKDVVSENIPLRQEEKSSCATVVINDDTICELVVDPAARATVLPYRVAVDAGVKVDAAPETTTRTADGSEAPAKRVLLKSVRVGSFAAKNVVCHVLAAENTTAKGVLGSSFLKQFKSELNAGGTELSLRRSDAAATTHKKKKTKHTSKKSSDSDSSDAQQ